ncbi:ABC transporter permease [Hamadaea tsunoensis]|uniref:ABC transporter permease n=1 Tax=Hamadaea tsunoensis TaxID=53368 RepID=UPI000423620E|nr:ABC transporter permease [Hamadaea tsunoensis]
MLDTLIAGLLHGNAYALVAVGISLIFGVTNVVNFAHMSVFGLGAMCAWFFIADLRWPFWATLAVVVAVTGLTGLLINLLVVRPLARYLPIAALLATYAVAQILDSVSQWVFGPRVRPFPEVLPTDDLHIGLMRFGTSDVVMLALTIAVMAALGLYLKFGKSGRAIRATSQDPEAALQMGIPVGRIQHLSFVIASALGGVAGVFVALYTGTVSPTSGATAGLTAFVAATLGGLGSIPGAVIGGFVLGVAEAFGVSLFGGSVDDIIMFAILILVLLVRPGGLLGRVPVLAPEPMTGTFLGRGRPIRLGRWGLVAVLAVGGVVIPVLGSRTFLTIGTQVLIYAIIGAGFTVTAGQSGVIALGQAGPIALGAYASALLALLAHWPFWVSLPVGGLVAAVGASVLGSALWRVKGHYISIATLGMGIVTVAILRVAEPLTRGVYGLYGIPTPHIGGLALDTPLAFYLIDFLVLVGTLAVVVRLRSSHLGRVMSAVGSDEVAAYASGIRVRDYKALAFAVSAFFAGVGGALLAHQYTYIDPDLFGLTMSLLVLTIVVLGGVNVPFGAVIGSIVLIGALEVFRVTPQLRVILYGLALILVVRFRPGGAWVRRA